MTDSRVVCVSCGPISFEIEGLASDPITKYHERTGKFYEIEELKRLTSVLRRYCSLYPSDYIIDAGANIGNHSLFLGANHESLNIVSFEMNPVTYAFLDQNIRKSGLTNVHINNMGLSNQAGACGIIQNKSNPLGGAQVDLSLGNDGGVKLTSLDICYESDSQFIGKKCCLLKLDVEGHEMEVLRGASAFLKDNMPLIYVELKEVKEFAEFSSYLFDIGYEIAYAANDALPNFLFIDSDKTAHVFSESELREIKYKLFSRIVDAWQLHRKIRSLSARIERELL